MNTLTGKPISFWIDSTPKTAYSSLENSLSVDVAIVGAGIVGLTAATLLKRAGKTVAVIESREIITGVTGHTTAKITSLHQLIYADLIKQIGEEKARLYAESNQAAEVDKIKDEVQAALKLGLPATFVQETSLPFAIACQLFIKTAIAH